MIRFLIVSLWVPYWQAVRIGDLELFRSVAERNAAVFATDKSQNLIVRLRHNVIRTGLRNISISYSRISLADVAQKLHLDSATAVDDAESIVTKAIRDGGIDASVDHSKGWMQSKETGDIYSTQVWLFNWEGHVLLQSKFSTFFLNKWLIERIYTENLVVIPFLNSWKVHAKGRYRWGKVCFYLLVGRLLFNSTCLMNFNFGNGFRNPSRHSILELRSVWIRTTRQWRPCDFLQMLIRKNWRAQKSVASVSNKSRSSPNTLLKKMMTSFRQFILSPAGMLLTILK